MTTNRDTTKNGRQTNSDEGAAKVNTRAYMFDKMPHDDKYKYVGTSED